MKSSNLVLMGYRLRIISQLVRNSKQAEEIKETASW